MDFSQITDELYIGATPIEKDFEILRANEVGLIINMRFEKRPIPDPHIEPIQVLWLRTFDSPLIPIPLSALKRGVEAALEMIESGKRVYAHCQAGVHRGVAMGATILISRGYTPQAAMELIKERRTDADPSAWYIKRQILRFDRLWNNSRGKPE